MIYLRLFWEFFKTGLFAIGGGMATLPFLYDMAEKTGWFTHELLADMIAIAESTPGPIGVNMATYVGFETAGIGGSIIATIGLITPSVIVILIVAAILDRFRKNRYVERALYGLRPASTGMIASAGFTVFLLALCNTELYAQTGLLRDLFSWKGLILAAVIWVATNLLKPTKKLHPLFFIAFSAVVGIVFSMAGA